MPPAPQLDLVTVVLPGPYLDLVALVPIWGSPRPGSLVSIWPHLENNDSDPYLGLSWTCCLWSLPGHHWDLDTLLYTWASPGLGDCVPTWASPGQGDWFKRTSPGPGDCGPTWNSPGSGGSGSHMGLSWTWFLWSPSGLTLNLSLIHI